MISLRVFLELTAQDEEGVNRVIARVFYTSAAVMQPIRHTTKSRKRLQAGTYCSIVKEERRTREEMVQLVSFKTRHAAWRDVIDCCFIVKDSHNIRKWRHRRITCALAFTLVVHHLLAVVTLAAVK